VVISIKAALSAKFRIDYFIIGELKQTTPAYLIDEIDEYRYQSIPFDIYQSIDIGNR
jgi:hypothetical protein